jgi:twitching motility protein PilT
LAELDELLQMLIEQDGSDLHLQAGEPPILRVHGCLQRTDLPPLTAEETKRLAAGILNEAALLRFAERLELEMSYATDFARFRVNVFREQGQVGAVLRRIPFTIPPPEALMLPTIASDLCLRPRGLLLITGPTGSGKSTTVASLVDHINTHRRVHIITIEDPIEYVYFDRQASVDQREVGQDTASFSAALQHARRQNPDVLVLSALRDAETIRLALDATEAGLLVLASLPTGDSPRTLERLIEMFPSERQRSIQTRLANALLGIVSQTLLPRQDTPGRVAAYEVLVAIPAIRTLIREGRISQIPAEVQTGSQYGMEALDHSLAALVRRNLVRLEDALAKAVHPREFEQRVGGTAPART